MHNGICFENFVFVYGVGVVTVRKFTNTMNYAFNSLRVYIL